MLAALILFAAVTGCAGEASAAIGSKKVPVEVANKLCEDWFQLLLEKENAYQSLYRMLDYTDAYLQDRSWDSLLKARAAASAGVLALRQAEIPTMSLTDEECALLIDAGIEVNEVQREYENLQTNRNYLIDTMSLWCYTLEDDVFLRTSLEEEIPVKAELDRDFRNLECRYYCNLTNYLLLQMGQTRQLWDQWLEQLPTLAAFREEWYEDIDAVIAQTTPILDEIALQEIRMGTVLGTSSYLLEIVQDAVETGDLTALSREVSTASDTPGYFPIPTWMPDVVKLYLVTEPDSGQKRLVRAGEELTGVPSACYISCGTIPQEEVENYQAQLEALGIATYGEWETPGETYQLLVKSDRSYLMVEWNQEETAIFLTEPVGCLIPALYYAAMQQ